MYLRFTILLSFFVTYLLSYDLRGAVWEAGNVFSEVHGLVEAELYDSAAVMTEQLLPLLSNGDELGAAYFTMGYCYRHSGRPFQAIDHYLRAVNAYTSLDCKVHCYNNIGLIYKGFNQHKKAVDFFTLAMNLCKPGSELAMLTLYNRATSLRRCDKVEEALEDLSTAEFIAYGLEDEHFRANIYTQIGLLYKFTGGLEKADGYFRKALDIGNTWNLYHNYANLKKEMGDTLVAVDMFKRALLFSSSDLILTHLDLGETYLQMGRRDLAYGSLLSAREIFLQENLVQFHRIRLFELLARATSDPNEASFYKDEALAAYHVMGNELKRSNEVFFGVIDDQIILNRELTRRNKTLVQRYPLVVTGSGLAICILLAITFYRYYRQKRHERIFRRINKIISDRVEH